MDRKNTSPQGETARVLVEFLEVAITSIVFLKGFYPSEAFERRRYMNVVVHRARHPQLSGYIHSVTAGLLPFVQKGLVERVNVIFYDNEHVPVEKFIFKIIVNQSYNSKVEENDLEFALRAFLIKLTIASPLPNLFHLVAVGRSLPTFEPFLRTAATRRLGCGFQRTQSSGCSPQT